MKKTIYQIMDENPELTPEEAGQRFVEQPESDAAVPEAGVASNSAERVRLDTTKDDYAPKMGLGIQSTNSQINPPHLGVQYPITAQQTANLKKYADSTLPTQEAAPVATEAQPKQLNEAEQYAKDAAAAQSNVKGIYDRRGVDAKRIGGEVEAEEDRIRKIRGESGTEAGLYGAGKVFSGMMGSMLGFDASHAKEGFSEAQKAVAGRTDEARQRREFLKERLYRTDDESKLERERLGAKSAARNETMDSALDPTKFNVESQTGKAKTMQAERSVADESEKLEAYDQGGVSEDMSRRLDKSMLERVAKSKGSNSEIAQEFLDSFDAIETETIDGRPSGLGTLSSRQRKPMMDALLKAVKDGTKYQFQKASLGGREVIGGFNPDSNEFTEFDSGKKSFQPRSGRTGKEITTDLLRKDYEKEYNTSIREAKSAVAKTRDMFEIAKTNPEAVGVLQYNIARSIAGEKGPLSNMDVQRAGLGSQQALDQLLQTLQTRGFGALTGGQKVTLEKLLNVLDERIENRGKTIQGRYQVRAREIDANERYIFGENVGNTAPPSDAPAQSGSSDEPKAGDVVDSESNGVQERYRFKGGDPNDQNNWELVK